MSENSIPAAAELVANAAEILFITGAGISADSGLPTYRGIGGLYEDADTDEGFSIEEALSGEMLARRPDVCWKYLEQIGAACRGAQPNRAHEVIAELEAEKKRVWTLTQNVDGLHRRAGSRNVIAIHGEIDELYCLACGKRSAASAVTTIPPRCDQVGCGGLLRPDVVLFGETLPLPALEVLRRERERGFDLVVSIGTTAIFPYIAEPVLDAVRLTVPTLEINPGESAVSASVDVQVRERAAMALDQIWKLARTPR